MKVPRCKGTRDLLPAEMALFRYIEGIFRTCCLQCGYEEVRTPTLEYLHLFTSAGTLTPDMLSRVYSFLDWDGWSGERVVLRPDGTIPTARLYVESFQHRPLAKLFYVENIFTFEGTGQETRERWECGAELIGSSGFDGDVELIMLALEVLKKLGIDPLEVRLSHAGLIKALLTELGSAELLEQVLDGNREALSKVGSKNPELEKQLTLLFGLTEKSEGFLKKLRAIFPALGSTFDDLARVTQLLGALGCNYQINLASGVGFEYYTGTIFQLYSLGQRLGGGGRYDELIPLVGGGAIPASGFALYVDHIISLVQAGELRPASRHKVLIKPRASTTEELKSCFEVAGLLRGAGFVAELDLGYREAIDFRWVLTVSEGGFDLTDQVSGKKLRGLSGAEILRQLEEARCS